MEFEKRLRDIVKRSWSRIENTCTYTEVKLRHRSCTASLGI